MITLSHTTNIREDGAMQRTVGYLRVSTAGQAEEGLSLEAQRRKITAYCDLYNLELVEIIEDAGLSGKSINGRPGMQSIISLINARKIDHLVVVRLDRLARNVREAVELAELMQKRGIALHSITERLDTSSATGRLFYNIVAAMAAWEREIIAERTVSALAVKRADGLRISGQAPYGFAFDDTGAVVECPEEQETIRRVLDLHREGHSIRKIRATLAASGYVNRNGRPFGVSELWTIIKRAA